MSGFWHAIWPGWTAIVSNLFLSLLTLPIVVGGQLFLMHLIGKLKNHIVELAAFNRALAAENESLQRRLVRDSRIARMERPDAFQGW